MCNIFLISGELEDSIDKYLSGQETDVTENYAYLQEKYGDEPSFIFLNASIEEQGPAAVAKYKDLYEQHPENKYSPVAVMKLAEYYYVTGLYIKACEWLKKFLYHYPQHESSVRALRLLDRALSISGEADSARYYVDYYTDKTIRISEILPDQPILNPNLEPIDEPEYFSMQAQAGEMKYGVQVGLFGSLENAGKRLQMLQDNGYSGRIQISVRDGRSLNAVVIGEYDTDDKARKISNKIKSSLGLDSFVVEL